MSDFNLSNKVLGCKSCIGAWLPFTDAERFIRELKDSLTEDKREIWTNEMIFKRIDKLAGDKFNGSI